MLVARANPWICLGLSFLWLLLSLLQPQRSVAVPSPGQIVFSALILDVLLLFAVFATAVTVPSASGALSRQKFLRAVAVLRADVLRPLRRVPFLRALGSGLVVGAALVLLSLALSLAVSLLVRAVGGDPVPQPVVEVLLRSALPGKAALVVSVVLATPVVEELFFRYALENALAGTLERPWALGLSALLFAGMHGSLFAFPALLLVAAGCSFVYRRTGSLLAPVAAHAVFNLASVLLLLAGIAA